MRPNRIAIITSSFPSSPEQSKNSGVFVRDVARVLAGAGHDVTVITPMSSTAAAEPYRVESFRWPGGETSLTHIKPRGLLNLIRLAAVLASGMVKTVSCLRRRRADHVIAMWAVPSGVLALVARRILGVPYSVWALGSDIWEIDAYPLGRFLLRRVLRAADHLYADGHELAVAVEEISGRRCTFLPSSRILPPRVDTAAYELDDSRTHLLTVARYHEHKGVDLLLDALKLIDQATSARLAMHIFGNGPQRAALQQKVVDNRLDAWVTVGDSLSAVELGAWLASAAALIIPSRIESIPLIITDAAQYCCPVITTDVGDLRRLVQGYGLGVVVPPQDPEALAEAITAAVTEGIHCDEEGARRLVVDLSVQTSCHTLLDRASSGPDRRLAARQAFEDNSGTLDEPDDFDPKTYWEQRLGADFTLNGVGIRRLGPSFNGWAYQVRRERFLDVVNSLKINPHQSTVLDIGSGTGFYIERWQELGAAKIIGSDIADTAVDRLRQRFPTLEFHQFDVAAQPPPELTSATFDVVDAMDVLFHILDETLFAKAIQNIHDLLKPGGVFIWTDSFVHTRSRKQRHIVLRTLSESEAVLKAAGFDIIKREPLFVLMNAPVDTRNPLAAPAWKAAAGIVSLSDRLGDRVGRLLYRWERRLVTTRSESPTIEIMVCQKRG